MSSVNRTITNINFEELATIRKCRSLSSKYISFLAKRLIWRIILDNFNTHVDKIRIKKEIVNGKWLKIGEEFDYYEM